MKVFWTAKSLQRLRQIQDVIDILTVRHAKRLVPERVSYL